MSTSIILTTGESVHVAMDAVDWKYKEMLGLDPKADFTVVSYEGTYGSKKPVRVIISDSAGNEYEVSSNYLSYA